MKRNTLSILVIFVLGPWLCGAYVELFSTQHSISTRAGLINRIQGKVFIYRAPDKDPEAASAGLQMADGDRLSTDLVSRVEIIVNPAAYIILDMESEIRALSTQLTETRFEFIRGSFMILAGNPLILRTNRRLPLRSGPPTQAGSLTSALNFEVVTPQGILTVTREGLYGIRVDATSVRIDVFEGQIALGTRAEGLRARKIKAGRRARLSNPSRNGLAVQESKLRIPEDFDAWHMPVPPHGRVIAVEGRAFWSRPDLPDRLPVTPAFVVHEGEALSTESKSYLELLCRSGPRVCMDQQTQLRATGLETEEAAFELQRGVILVDSTGDLSRRSVTIHAPRNSFVLKHGCLARIDVDDTGTAIRVWRGRAQSATGAIEHGQQLFLTNSSPPGWQLTRITTEISGDFERRSTGLMGAGLIQRHDGRVILEREKGGRLELDKSTEGVRAQLLETGHLITMTGGRASMMFAAGALHVDEDSEIVAVSSSAETREFRLVKGSIIVYAEPFLKLRISTPFGIARISGVGTFRFDLDETGARIRVRSGSLRIASADSPETKLKRGQSASLAGSSPAHVSKDTDSPDAFDLWSTGAREFPFQAIRR